MNKEKGMKKRLKRYAVCILLIGLMSGCSAHSGRIPGYMGVVPEDYGVSSGKLSQISEAFQKDIDNDMVPGAVALIARRGKIVYLKTFGMQDTGKKTPMAEDSIFRIASMTKPVTSVAALILHEQGKLHIDDPVSKYLPEFRNMKVGIEERGDIVRTEPLKREMTIKDLLMHTSGLSYGIFVSSPIRKMYLKKGIHSRDQSLSEMTKKLGTIPLLFQPGTKWEYSRSSDVLGRVIEKASGMRLDRFMKQSLFDPLDMKDTGFYVKKKDLGRVAEATDMDLWAVNTLPKKLSGGGGLVSTTRDYYRFAQMLLNGGEFEGRRILKQETVSLMTRDHLGELAGKSDSFYLPGKGYGFGLGVAVRTKRKAEMEGTVGDYWWEGITGTGFWVDPKKELVAIIMIQDPQARLYYRKEYRKRVYNALKNW